MKLKGKVHKYGCNVDTDAIVPARHLNLSEPEDLAQHCMEDLDADFVKEVRPGDIIVAVDATRAGDTLEIDLDAGEITNVTRKRTYKAKPFPPFMLELIRDGGLIEHTRKRLAKSKRRATK